MKSNDEIQRKDHLDRINKFEDLTRVHLESLCRTAFRMTGCQEIARDLTQETCLKAYRSLHSFQEGTNYKAWIFRILTNQCMDYLRREARAPFKEWKEDEVDCAIALSEDIASRPDTILEHRSFYEDAIAAIGLLPAEIRVVVCFSLIDGLSYQEIAEIVDIPIGTVRSRLSRGRKKLQTHLVKHTKDECSEIRAKKAFNEKKHWVKESNLVVVRNKQKFKC